MKKGKFLALALVVAIMMMGAGYAYWTESGEINTTVNTGELDFRIENPEVKDESEYMSGDVYGHNTKKLNVQLRDVYPGAEFTVEFDLNNTGTMPAKIKNVKFTDYNWHLGDNLELIEASVPGLANGSVPEIPLNELNDYAHHVDNLDAELPIEGNATISYTFKVSEDAVESNFNEERDYNFNIEADVLQFNDPNEK